MLLSISQFVGRLHPALVHLPIGILLIGLLVLWVAHRKNNAALLQAAPFILLAGSLTAMLSCITGAVLYSSDDYDKTLVNWHMWMGIATALVSFMLYAKVKNPQFGVDKRLLALGLLALIFITGHLGGSLTHGADYFTQPLTDIFSGDSTGQGTIKPVANVQEANVYAEVVQPILQTKCYSCHGTAKQKGGLRMNDSIGLMKGGKDGLVIKPGDSKASEMIKRMLLDAGDDDHMPPKEKPQPTKQQLALLHWWIDNGASFSQKVKNLPQPADIKPLLEALQKGAGEDKKQAAADIPAEPTDPGDAAAIQKLTAKGIVVLPVGQESNYLLVNFVTDTLVDKEVLHLLAQLKKQVAWLKLGGTSLTNEGLATLADFSRLTRLDVSHTRISDKGLAALAGLPNLHYLNLTGCTGVTAAGLQQLAACKNLRAVYVYQSGVKSSDYSQLKSQLRNTAIDTGGYVVPTLSTDTTQVKAKQAY